jgi:hypothetical protein
LDDNNLRHDSDEDSEAPATLSTPDNRALIAAMEAPTSMLFKEIFNAMFVSCTASSAEISSVLSDKDAKELLQV